MVLIEFFSWWYRQGWHGVLTSTRRRVRNLAQMFSTGTLLRTLFAPWRRIVTEPGAGLDAKARAFGDNLVSRCIGFVVRFFVLLAAACSLILLLIAGIIELLAWPLLPVAAIVLIVAGVL